MILCRAGDPYAGAATRQTRRKARACVLETKCFKFELSYFSITQPTQVFIFIKYYCWRCRSISQSLNLFSADCLWSDLRAHLYVRCVSGVNDAKRRVALARRCASFLLFLSCLCVRVRHSISYAFCSLPIQMTLRIEARNISLIAIIHTSPNSRSSHGWFYNWRRLFSGGLRHSLPALLAHCLEHVADLIRFPFHVVVMFSSSNHKSCWFCWKSCFCIEFPFLRSEGEGGGWAYDYE